MIRSRYSKSIAVLALMSPSFTACGNSDPAETPEEHATLEVKDYITAELEALHASAQKIQDAAPEPDSDGWNPKDDAAAVKKMRDAWADTRDRYEHIEGAIAVLFPDLDVSTDARYDDFIADGPDEDLFDGEGATGMHAIERILWAGEHPAAVVAFESKLDGYVEAAFPSNEKEADEFKNELAQRLVDDTAEMSEMFEPLALDASSAFRGVIGSMQEQVEKVLLAATAEDESRYAQRTLDDMRANLAGGKAVYGAFREWVQEDAGDDVDTDIQKGFAKIESAYDQYDGPAIPEVPQGFDPDDPSADDLKTGYGKLWSLLDDQTDTKDKLSLVSQMLKAADAMDIPRLPE
jgi:iron uptake system component EfeO